jgi:hypothetical protein
MRIILILNSLLGICLASTCPNLLPWDYGARGPEIWPFIYSSCAGVEQSPINIIGRNAKFNPNLRPFELVNDNKWISFEATNEELSIYFKPVDEKPILLEGSTLTKEHKLQVFIFRWVCFILSIRTNKLRFSIIFKINQRVKIIYKVLNIK